MVTINYRLGSLGFLSIPKLSVPANLGLKDQVTAMKWVQHNIHSFKGDPNKVTIIGWSAGAASVTYHLYSKMSSGLFHQAIVMSGSFLNPWAFSYQPEKCARNFLTYLNNFENITSKDDLKKLDLSQIIPKFNVDLGFANFGLYFFCFVPVVESVKDSEANEELFLTESPHSLFQKPPINDVPLIIGHTALEVELMFPDVKYEMSTENLPNHNGTICDAVKKYIEDFELRADREGFLTKLCIMSDIFYGIQLFVNNYTQLAKSNLYAYRFEFDGKFGHFKAMKIKEFRERNRYGAIHGDELGYLFQPFHNVTTANRHHLMHEKNVSKTMRILWTNFIRTG